MQLSMKNIIYGILIITLTLSCKLVFANNISWSGFSPIMAIALVSGMMIHQKHSTFLFPLIALVASDVIIEILYLNGLFGFPGIYSYQFLNYLFLSVLVSIGWLLKGKSYSGILIGIIAGPTIYYLLSNGWVWATHGGYQRPLTLEGLGMCMLDGLPFYKNSLLSTLVFVPVLLMIYHVLSFKKLALKLQ
ncbi:DUF6580 family putative transport protein [Hydrotalea sp.]|uniref:DUF6580 family putative transport protein n=1 Tax=Hydrotalea sp. TaxID=2881279 RepID=UPI003D13D360